MSDPNTIGQIISLWAIAACAVAFLAGLILMRWGRKMPRQGDWLAGCSLACLLIVGALVYYYSSFAGLLHHGEQLVRGWIWPKSEPGAIVIGVQLDNLGLAFAGVGIALSVLFLLNRTLIAKEPRAERFYSAATISSAGLSLAWVAATPWTAFAGSLLTIFGGFLALGSKWHIGGEADAAVRLVRERTWGLVLSLVGACALASQGSLLIWNDPAAVSTVGGWLGAGILACGLFLQLQPFPLLGWVVKPTESLFLPRILFAQVFPAWASFAVFVHYVEYFHHVGVFPIFGWAALASAVLSTATGIFQKDWKAGLSAWVSSSFAIALAALSFSGPRAAIALALGGGLAAIAMAWAGSRLLAEPRKNESSKGTAWAKIACAFAAAAGTGMIGFVSCDGNLRWLTSALNDSSLIALFSFVLFLFALLAWKLFWGLSRSRASVPASWLLVVSPYLVLVISLGVVWTGHLSGGAIPGHPDLVIHSAFNDFFGAGESATDVRSLLNASWFHWTVLVLAISTAYWTSGRDRDLWQALSRAFPKMAGFFADGYGMDNLGGRMLSATSKTGSYIQNVVDGKIWGEWLPHGVKRGGRAVAYATMYASNVISNQLDKSLRRGVEVPAKFLQLIQSGDVQWYLFFAIGSGVAILIHFLRLK